MDKLDDNLFITVCERRIGVVQATSVSVGIGNNLDDKFYEIIVDYEENLEASKDITSENYPPPKSGRHYAKIAFFHFGKAMPISISEIQNELRNIGLCFADPYHVMAFHRKYPDIRLPYHIVALGLIRTDKFGWDLAPYMAKDGRWHENNLNYVSGGLLLECLIASVREEGQQTK